MQGSFRGFHGVSSDFRAVGEVFKRFSGELRGGLSKKLQEFQGVSGGFREILERLHRHSGELQGYFRRGSEEFPGVLEGFTSFQEIFNSVSSDFRVSEGCQKERVRQAPALSSLLSQKAFKAFKILLPALKGILGESQLTTKLHKVSDRVSRLY